MMALPLRRGISTAWPLELYLLYESLSVAFMLMLFLHAARNMANHWPSFSPTTGMSGSFEGLLMAYSTQNSSATTASAATAATCGMCRKASSILSSWAERW
ncbi:hypothetical protein GE09DRAFT_1132221 [Coniochaeta sp. 2T2.1]|nr:hypothetical protein GE09DRAFT_1132221 [Coniochaeta sp. 2T2.1]